MIQKDKSGKVVELHRNARFLAKDRNERVFEYKYTALSDGYEKLLKNPSDGTDTWVVSSWFNERNIEVLYPGEVL